MPSIDYPVDVVVTWVDGNDYEWQRDRDYYYSIEYPAVKTILDSHDERYRDWGTLRYFFRSVDTYAPWINKIHLVTCGHYPDWLNKNAPKLNLVKHTDFMDERYLPTFSSHSIEFNLHRIPNLADRFIYFNDDMLIARPTQQGDFFRRGLPVDFAVLNTLSSSYRFSMMDTALTNVEIVNDYFSKREVITSHLTKWINPKYGDALAKTLLLIPFSRFSNFSGSHFPHAYLKSTFEEVWAKESILLDEVCCRKFRTRRDPNHWLMREWQLVSGNFVPGRSKRGYYAIITDDKDALRLDFARIRAKRPLLICINDSRRGKVCKFEQTRVFLQELLDAMYPHKSSYEI